MCTRDAEQRPFLDFVTIRTALKAEMTRFLGETLLERETRNICNVPPNQEFD